MQQIRLTAINKCANYEYATVIMHIIIVIIAQKEHKIVMN